MEADDVFVDDCCLDLDAVHRPRYGNCTSRSQGPWPGRSHATACLFNCASNV